MQPLSYQLFSSRNFAPLKDVLKRVSQAGYTQVEGYGGLFPDMNDVTDLKAMLDENGLQMASSHIGLDALENNISGVVQLAKTLDITAIYCPHLMADQRPNDAAGWREFGARLQKLGEPLRDAGVTFGWHNHDFEFVPCPDGTIPQAAMLDGGPDLSWEVDVAWIVRGGANPLDWFEKYSDRITAMHVKDIAPQGECLDEDGWADVGQGTMDWRGILAAASKTNAKLYVMEHDNPSDDARFATRSFAAVSSY